MFKNVKKYLSFFLAIAMIATIIPANLAFASTAEDGTAITSREGIDADIRFALFGDTHVTAFQTGNDWTSADAALDPIMDVYKTIDPNMDAFVMPGDVIFNVDPAQEKTSDDEVKYAAVLAEINEDFATASTQGENANIVWAVGNHEITIGAYKNTATTGFVNGTWEAEVADNLARYKNALGRDPIDSYEVNGYTFITAAPYDYLNNYVNPDDKTVISENETKIKELLEAALAKDATKPVFYLQHEALDETNIASSTSPTRNSAEFRNFIISNPRIVTLSGHSHYAANDPRTFVQLDGGSTHINIPATMGSAGSYGCTKDIVTDNASATQGMLVEVTGNEVTVRRFDYVDKKYIGEPYVFTAGAEAKTEYTKAGREVAKTSEVNKAYFAEGAKITVSDIETNTAKISFPEGKKDGESADGLQDNYIHYYRVNVANKATGATVKSCSLLGNYLLNSTAKVTWKDPSQYPDWDNSRIRKNLDREVSLSDLKRNTTYTVTVTPESALGQKGTPLTCEFTTSAEKTAEELALTTRIDNKNVALGKTAVAQLKSGSTSNWTKITDGNLSTSISNSNYGTIADNGAVTLDLGRRYNIEQIVFTVSSDSQAKHMYKIQVSNDANFADATTKTLKTQAALASVNTATGWTDNTTLTLTLDGSTGYRYVRYLNTSSSGNGKYMYMSELQVFADEYITDISKAATVTASHSYTGKGPEKVIDGKVTEAGSWWSGWNSKYYWLQIDLGASLPVSMIQVDAGPDEEPSNFTDAASRHAWYIYGSNTVADSSALLDSTTISADGYTKLAYAEYLPKYKADGTVYSLNNSSGSTTEGIARSSFDGTRYQYITLKHADINFASIGEVTIWATNPVLNGISKTDSGINLSFSDAMDTTTINSNSIKLYDANGSEITDAVLTPSSDGYDVLVTGADDAIKVEVTYALKNQYGMEVAGDFVKYLESNIDYSNKPVTTENNINVAKGKAAIANLASGSTANWTNVTDGKTSTFGAGTLAQYGSVTIDLGASYNVKKVVLDVPDYSQARQTYEMQLSNDPNFADSTTKTIASRGAVSSLDVATEFVNGTTLTVSLNDGMFYRYVRYYNSTGATGKYLYMNEIEVYADRNLMEISRGITPTASNTYSGYSLSGLTDGVNTSKTGGWASGWNTAAEWINLDLGAVMPITRIELESVYNGTADGDYNSRRYWNIYGSNVTPTVEDLNTTTASGDNYMISADGYTLLDTTSYGCMPSYNQGVFDEQVYYSTADVISKWNSGSYGNENGILRSDISGDYRYLTVQKGYKGYATMGEIRAYIVAPMASAKIDSDTVTVNFSENMFPHYLTSDYIKLYDNNDNLVAYSNGTMVDNDTFTFTADLTAGKTYKVVVDKGVKAVTSIPLGIDNVITFTAPSISSAVTVKDAQGTAVTEGFTVDTVYSFDVAVTSPFSIGTSVRVVVAQYNGNELVKAELSDITAVANATTTATVSGFKYAADNTFKVYVWDMDMEYPYCAEIVLPTEE